MAKPLVAIVGRPNVGKSTFFNRVTGTRLAITEDTPGVTRDRLYADAEWLTHEFTLVDTGGIDTITEDVILKQIKMQAELAVESAQLILFFVDGKTGITSEDYEIARLLRRSYKPVIVVVNKVDNKKDEANLYDFYELGLGAVCGISASAGLGIGDLLDEVVKYLEADPDVPEDDGETVKIALVGRPNVGKSSLTNRILGEERSIVSDVPGTTRDATDTDVVVDGTLYTVIDTAGMRKKGKIEDKSVERYSVIRSLSAIRRCDVAVVLIDATEGITEQDVKVAGYVKDEGKPCVIAVNKWDAVDKDSYTTLDFDKRIRADLAFMPYASIVYLSALTGQRVPKLFAMIQEAYVNSLRRIQTGVLNDALQDAVTAVEPPSDHGRRLKILYVTQGAVQPPTFILFVNDGTLLHFSYRRYLENYLRKTFDFAGTPIRMIVRSRDEERD